MILKITSWHLVLFFKEYLHCVLSLKPRWKNVNIIYKLGFMYGFSYRYMQRIYEDILKSHRPSDDGDQYLDNPLFNVTKMWPYFSLCLIQVLNLKHKKFNQVKKHQVGAQRQPTTFNHLWNNKLIEHDRSEQESKIQNMIGHEQESKILVGWTQKGFEMGELKTALARRAYKHNVYI